MLFVAIYREISCSFIMSKDAENGVYPPTQTEISSVFSNHLRILLKWYRCSGRMVPCGAEVWYHSYRSEGTGTNFPIYTLSKGAVRKVQQGTL